MTAAELNTIAKGWLAYWQAQENSAERKAFSWAVDHEYDLISENPDKAWLLILA